jgi:DNA-binding protein HU-beta
MTQDERSRDGPWVLTHLQGTSRLPKQFLEAVVDTLKGGGEVTFTGFGKFSTAQRKERMGVNPRNPTEKVHIPAARVPKFSAGSGLKSAVKQTSSY